MAALKASRFLGLMLFASAQAIVIKNSPVERAHHLLSKMSLDDKIAMMHGTQGGYIGNTVANERLGIPPLNLNDGPQGFRTSDELAGTTTAFPCALAVASTWDLDAMQRYGAAMGAEFKGKGSNVQLGPGMCVARVPRCGRNFEYVSGEDPHLGYKLVRPLIEGIQSQGVIANAKHWINNNQEWDRFTVDESVDERTRFEMYYPPFEGAIEADVGSFMCSYNKINGYWSCENDRTLRKDLKETLGFKGWVMSDWGATHSTSLAQGLDQEMPDGDFMNSTLKEMVKNGTLEEKMVDESILRMLIPMFKLGVMDAHKHGEWDLKKINANVSTQAHVDLTRKLGAEGTILMKNEDSTLPIKKAAGRNGKTTIQLVGTACDSAPFLNGGGSGRVQADERNIKTPYTGVKSAAGESYDVMLIDTDNPVKAVAQLASEADYTIVCVGANSTEGSDRANLSLSHTQDALIEAVASKYEPNKDAKVIVAASIGGAILTPWASSVDAFLVNFYAGQEYGNAFADVVFGKVSPSGKLPLSFPNVENEVGFEPSQYPGIDQKNVYSERLLVGYRWYNFMGVTPAFPFGHGLGYAEMEYTNLTVSQEDRTVSFTITNTGSMSASEVAQVYLVFPQDAKEPPMQLKAFEKTDTLKPKASQQVSFSLSDRAFSVYSATAHKWGVKDGKFGVLVGSSSADIRLQSELVVTKEYAESRNKKDDDVAAFPDIFVLQKTGEQLKASLEL